MVTKAQIAELLGQWGLQKQDKVMVHASLRSIGEIENGADGLIDALKDYLSQGLLLIPTHTWDNVDGDNPFFDVRETEPCIGALACVAAKRTDGIRSLHPTHSVAAFGPHAAQFVAGEERCASPAPPGSCVSRLYEEGGKVLLLGVGLDKCTYLHAVDERLGIPDRLKKSTFTVTIRDYDGNEFPAPPFHEHFTEASDRCVSEYYGNYLPAFLYHGAVSEHRLGGARVLLCDCRKMTDCAKMIWERAGRDLWISAAPIAEEYYK